MLKKIIILLVALIGLGVGGYYILYTQGAFQTKEEIYHTNQSPLPPTKCEAGKCGASMQKFETKPLPTSKKCMADEKCASGKCGNN